MTTEAELQTQVADYIKLKYPDVLFHSDFGSGIKLTLGQARKQKRQNGGRRGWPDMFIAEHCLLEITEREPFTNINYQSQAITLNGDIAWYAHGLFLELKKDGTRLKKKNGEWASPHIAEQAKILDQLRGRGYAAEFAVGFDEAKKIIDEYLGDK
ncbi:hypothetical protein IJI55_00910 [Candidatus Saccharibacteria bacterium]|nr:hypothetical protein [Candidatus Saccharibacteria bacterium]